ncbi:MAG: alpha/beta hydrolase [Chitinophagaceae bacterium]|nr:alpha/beta hydrolase [Chitinophagaceae bacterium]
MKKILSLILIAGCIQNALLSQEVIPLYGKVPNSKPSPDKEERVVTDNMLRISRVSVPTLTMYASAVPGDKKTAIIICPGGGYARLAASHEGVDVAKVFNEWGITAFVLKYRLPDDTIMEDKSIGPLQDAQRALQLVRENAGKWNIDPSKTGIMGFSAGGHLAATASTHFNKAVIENNESISLRPDFSVLIYPVISFSDSLAHMGSRNNLVGKMASPEKIAEYSNELQVTQQTPPAFLVHAGDDRTVKVQNSIRYYESLLKNSIPAELHLYPKGGHGFGMNNKTTADKWMERLKNWLQSSGYL